MYNNLNEMQNALKLEELEEYFLESLVKTANEIKTLFKNHEIDISDNAPKRFMIFAKA